MGYVGSTLWKLRQKIGTEPVVMAGVGLVVRNAAGKIWLAKRSDDGCWSYFGGAIELGDSVRDTATNEMREEASVLVPPEAWTLVALHTDPAETSCTYPNGDRVQIVNSIFESTLTFEEIPLGDDEHTEVGVFSLDALPSPMKRDTELALKLYEAYVRTGLVQVK